MLMDLILSSCSHTASVHCLLFLSLRCVLDVLVALPNASLIGCDTSGHNNMFNIVLNETRYIYIKGNLMIIYFV